MVKDIKAMLESRDCHFCKHNLVDWRKGPCYGCIRNNNEAYDLDVSALSTCIEEKVRGVAGDAETIERVVALLKGELT